MQYLRLQLCKKGSSIKAFAVLSSFLKRGVLSQAFIVSPSQVQLANSKTQLSVEGFSEKHLPVRLTVLDREKRMIAERTISYPAWLLGSERVQEVVPVQGHPRLSEYRTWHTLEGLAAYALLLTAQDELAETQRKIADGLKGFMEKSRAKTI